jgi:hypothetical protein
VQLTSKKATTWIAEETRVGDVLVKLPVQKPDVEIPVIELFLK